MNRIQEMFVGFLMSGSAILTLILAVIGLWTLLQESGLVEVSIF